MFVVFRLCGFEFEFTNCPLPYVFDSGNMIGYLPVYSSREEAEADYPDSEIREIRLAPEAQQPGA